MRAAPPVSVRGSGGLGWRLLQTLLTALAAGVLCGWALLRADGPALPASLAAAAAGLVAWRLSAAPSASLVWDGQCWAADGMPGSVNVMMDLGSWLLLRVQPDAAGTPCRWMAITAAEAGPALHALRAALYAQRPAAADPALRAPPTAGRPG